MFRERPSELKLFDSMSPEYELANSFVQESIEIVSPPILYFCTNLPATKETLDNVDIVYGETKNKITFLPPKKIVANPQLNPILEELTSLGLAQLEELNLVVSIPYIIQALGQEPKGGDVFRISYMENGRPFRDVFYMVNNAIPVNLFNFQYLNYTINAQQTQMTDVPSTVKNYLNLE